MKKAVEYTSWPLPELLTRKIVNYLDIYRLLITVFLGVVLFASLDEMPAPGTRPFFAGIVIAVYLLFALFYLFRGKEIGIDVFALEEVIDLIVTQPERRLVGFAGLEAFKVGSWCFVD